MLDRTRVALKRAGISYVRIDGDVKPTQRSNILQEFPDGSDTNVLPLTLSCGAIGFTLTSASRAYCMEPPWNPSIEEQAFSRIHRISQTREVTTMRFIIEDSIEKYVLDVQEEGPYTRTVIAQQSFAGNLSAAA
ncbi:P-loop containing nucleoside triphosphate hydrolase protein [Annulohypoxylon maeteangense]|uniref:P-loop containing nucleoside triphosphate hydrolase protein n=1 Tax=Annulohypoxylon maeteangense TaxID=1927788 RepID=UPI0020072921|nr:P-loop containing nucleoside triphosphate hydrolase protein [Annulohypoxylon maeteangense]KAI0886921.1 P-loop containing nucleoside triphosphate hydrolase protein [Annulohypoxylon maeteangense]